MDRCLQDAQRNTARVDRDRSDWLNLLMYRGGADNQWVVWDRAQQAWVPRGDDPDYGGLPPWIPRCVSNQYAIKIDGIAAILCQAEPAQLWAPATDDDEDVAAADLAQRAVPVFFEELGYEDLRQQVAKLVTLIDKVAVVVYYDTDPKWGMETIPALRCNGCSSVFMPAEASEGVALDGAPAEACPACGHTDVAPAMGQDGAPVGEQYPVGRLRADLIPSFEFSLPRSARGIDARTLPWVLTHSRMPTEDALRLWPHARAAIEGASGGRPAAGALARTFSDAMRQLSSPRQSQTTGSSSYGSHDGPIVYRLQHDPIEDADAGISFPEGLYAVMIGEEIVEAGPLPVQDDEGRPVKSILIRSFMPAPGSPFGKPPADDLVPLQVTRNTVETLLLAILMHDAAPRTYIPLSVSIEDEITGAPGQTIRYGSTVPGEKPQTDRGINPPEGIYKMLELIDQKFEELSRLNAVLAGVRPEGDPTLGEVQILQERGMAAFSEPLNHLVEFEKQLARLCLWIAKRSAWTPRFARVQGENGAWEVEQFFAADLTGRVDVTVEPQSAWPQSSLMRLMRLEKALAWGALPPAMQDPELQTKLLVELQLAEFKPSLDVDRKQIARALDRWKAATTPQEILPPNPIIDNLPLHRYLKTLFLKTEEAEALAAANPPLHQAMVMHVQQIDLLLMQQQMAAAGVGQPAGPDGSAVDAAVQSGALLPAGAQGDPMQDAVQSGLLVPQGGGPRGPSVDELMAGGVLSPAQGNGQPAMPPM